MNNSTVDEWFLSLSKGRQDALKENKWVLADAVWKAAEDKGLLNLEAKQAKIDQLMLEFCPDEMSKDQLSNWEKHQKYVEKQE